jgi:hypothetical protein
MGVYIPLIIRVIGVCSSVVTTPASPAHIRLGTIELVTDATLTEPSPAIHLVLTFMESLAFLKLTLVTFQLPADYTAAGKTTANGAVIADDPGAATKFGSILFPPIKLANIPGIIDNKPLVALPLPEPIPSNKTILSPLVPMSIYF